MEWGPIPHPPFEYHVGPMGQDLLREREVDLTTQLLEHLRDSKP